MNRRRAAILVAAIALVGAGATAGRFVSPALTPEPTHSTATVAITPYFSPRGGCEVVILERLNAARTSVDVQAYGFSNADIAKALTNAAKRGVKVRIVLDKSNQTARYSAATFLANNGIVPLIDAKHAIAHSKVMIIDAKVVITGSYNFTEAAENSNAENLLVIENGQAIVAAYTANFESHLQHSKPYEQSSE